MSEHDFDDALIAAAFRLAGESGWAALTIAGAAQSAGLSLAEAIHALAAKPAKVMGLDDRGILAPGYKADVNVIDLNALALHGPVVRFDLPGKGRRLDQAATGYVATLVNGRVIRRHDASTGARPGRVVRGSQPAPVEPVPA